MDADTLESALKQSVAVNKTLWSAYAEHNHEEDPTMGMYLASLVTGSDSLVQQILSAIMFKSNRILKGE